MNEDQLMRGVFQVLIFWALTTPHEFAHAWMADRLGDDTPRHQGRLTLNPMAHVDWVGTVFLPLITTLLAGGFLGWGRPVETNPLNFKGWRRDMLLVALAGPASNLLMCIGLALLAGFLPGEAKELPILACFTSFYLAFFNLIPIPPLDGSKVWLLSPGLEPVFMNLSRFGFLGLLLLFNMTNLGTYLSGLSMAGTTALLRLFSFAG